VFIFVGLSKVQKKSSLTRRSLSYGVEVETLPGKEFFILSG